MPESNYSYLAYLYSLLYYLENDEGSDKELQKCYLCHASLLPKIKGLFHLTSSHWVPATYWNLVGSADNTAGNWTKSPRANIQIHSKLVFSTLRFMSCKKSLFKYGKMHQLLKHSTTGFYLHFPIQRLIAVKPSPCHKHPTSKLLVIVLWTEDTFLNPTMEQGRACSESAQPLRVTHGAVFQAGCGQDAASVPGPRALSQGDEETVVMFLLLNSSPLSAGFILRAVKLGERGHCPKSLLPASPSSSVSNSK